MAVLTPSRYKLDDLIAGWGQTAGQFERGGTPKLRCAGVVAPILRVYCVLSGLTTLF